MARARPSKTLLRVLALVTVCAMAALSYAQWPDGFRGRRRARVDLANLPPPDLSTNPSFAFARVRFSSDGMRRRPGWSHDYPQAERNFLRILAEVTMVHTVSEAHVVVDLASPDIMNYPILYFSEPGEWAITPEESKNFRDFLLKGGFAIFDDFDGEWDWQNLVRCMAQVLPGYHFEELRLEEPVFQSFFGIDTLEMIAPYGSRDNPSFHGMKDDEGRLRVVANYNNDIGDYWEWSEAGFYPIDLSNEGYKFGINYVIYGMLH